MELALQRHTCHMCTTARSCPAVPLAHGISWAWHSGIAELSCLRSALRSGRFSELLLSPALTHHVSCAVREGPRAEQLCGAVVRGRAPVEASTVWISCRKEVGKHTTWQGISKQHKKLQSTNLTYFLGRERMILSRGKTTVTPLCTLGVKILCALHLFTQLYQQRIPENREKYLLLSVRWVTCTNKITWPDPLV